MADNFSKWLGGLNFTLDKEGFQNSPRQTVYYRSGLAGLVPNGKG